ncbi:MAG: hypothetical protein EU547_00295 [Promethearchaeota archaeon]|nr:MAG: hypothetical protein EU547_00295 [Candidatus Lokiarchaeota archaeon]
MISCLSYFHRKIGPLVFYSYPENMLDDKLSTRIANIMDQQFTEGFFTHSFKEIITMNYYFEIQSDWARGNYDMLMISFIFNQQINSEVEEKVKDLCVDFADKLKSDEDMYTAFHISDLNNFELEEQDLIIKKNKQIKSWIKDLYWEASEVTREKSEEERLASVLNEDHTFLALKKLRKGPLPLEWLKDWFEENFADKDFSKMIKVLKERQLIFINQIGIVEKYILLLKEVNAERIPPDNIIEFIDETPELIGEILPKVKSYFSKYEKKTNEELEKDESLLYEIISDPTKYKILSKLRNDIIPKKNADDLITQRDLEDLEETLDFLEIHDIIEEVEFKDEKYLVLKSNFQITTAFPEYLRKSLPEEIRPSIEEKSPVIADKYDPKAEIAKKQREIAEILKDARKKDVKKSKEEKITSFLEDLASKSEKRD